MSPPAIRTSVVMAVLISLVSCSLAQSMAGSASSSNQPAAEVRVDAVDSNGDNISVTDCSSDHVCVGQSRLMAAANSAVKTAVKAFHVGDHLSGLQLDDKNQLKAVSGLTYAEVSGTLRFITLALFAFLFLGIAAAATKGAPQRFIIGADNRYSNSKFQVVVWFWLLLTTYLAAIFLRVHEAGWDFFGLVNIPQNLLLLSGLSTLTYGGAKAITTAKVDSAVAAGIPDPKPAAAKPHFFADLVQNDGTPVPAGAGAAGAAPGLNAGARTFDFGDFETVVVTMIAVLMYLMLAFHFLGKVEFSKSVSLPDVDTTLLASFGLGQGAYLTKKAAGNVGTS